MNTLMEKLNTKTIYLNDFPFLEIDKLIRRRLKQKERWGYSNPHFEPKDKGYSFEYNFKLKDTQYKGRVHIGLNWDNTFIIVITDKNNNVLKRFDDVLIFWIEDKIDTFFRDIDFYK